jgi:hypothetical protein
MCVDESNANSKTKGAKSWPIYISNTINTFLDILTDALPSPGVNTLEGSPKCSCGKLGLGRRSRLPTLERSRGSS